MIKALILIGGNSKRLGKAKHLLDFHGNPQYLHLCKLLDSLGLEYFVSCNKNQSLDLPDNIPKIVDGYQEIGPMGGILSAFEIFPETALLVIACDLPFANHSNIELLLSARDVNQLITTYRVNHKFLETTFTIYESSCYSLLLESYNCKNYSLQSIMKDQNLVNTLEPIDENDLLNVNYQNDLDLARNKLRTKR